MKIVLLSTSDSTGGAAVVSKRLVEAFSQQGVDATMLVLRRGDQAPNYVQALLHGGRSRFLAERAGIFVNNGFNRRDLFKVSTANAGFRVADIPVVREADAILLGWINQGFISLDEIQRLCSLGKPVVWTMHDQWCSTGICHLSGSCSRFTQECGECPLLHWRKSPHDLSWRVWKRKKQLYSTCSNLKFVAVSNWLAARAKESSLLGSSNVKVIPNAYIIPSAPELNITRRNNTIVFAAARLDDDVKNLPLAVESLNLLWRHMKNRMLDVRVELIGNLRDASILNQLTIPYKYWGPLAPKQIASIMNNSKVVLSTSRFEMLPTTIVEGLAWGCAGVATNMGGQSDIIDNGVNGFLVPGKADKLAAAMDMALNAGFAPEELRASIEDKFSPQRVVAQYMEMLAPER